MLRDKPLWPVLPVQDYQRAKHFYEDKLGFRVMDTPTPGYGVCECGRDAKIMLYERAPVHIEHTEVSWLVDDVEAEVRELESRGVMFEDYDMPDLKTEHHIATMDGMKSAWFKDTEGNILSIGEMPMGSSM